MTATDTTTEVVVPDRTDAELEAELLFDIAQHLRKHVDLEPVDVYPASPDDEWGQLLQGHPLHLSRVGPGRAHALTVWALTLSRPGEPGPTVVARAVGAHCLDADIFVCGQLATGRRIRVWAEVKGFSVAVGLPDPDDPDRLVQVDLDQLHAFDATVLDASPFAGNLATLGDTVTDRATAATEVA